MSLNYHDIKSAHLNLQITKYAPFLFIYTEHEVFRLFYVTIYEFYDKYIRVPYEKCKNNVILKM